ncbi:MAG: tetratricopeptide repeat protein [Alphaproteobacteria bacterium]
MASVGVSEGQILQDALDHHRAGRLPEAEKLYRRILNRNPNHTDALHLLGLIANRMGAHDAAIDLIQRAAKNQPRRPDILSNLGLVYSMTNRHADAIVVLQRAITLGGVADIRFNLGNAYQGLNRHSEAAAAFVKALEKAPTLADAWLNLGISLIHLHQPKEAIHALNQHLELNSFSSRAQAMKLHALCMQGDDAKVAQLYDFDRDVTATKLKPPLTYTNINDFNAELEVQIRSRPGLRSDFQGVATRNGQQALALQVEPPPAIRRLETALRPLINDYISVHGKDIDSGGIGAAQGRPYTLNINATILDTNGYQESHIHPNGIVSGVYYVRIPNEIGNSPREAEQTDDDATAGWIEFGRPGSDLPPVKTELIRRIKPEAGTVFIFPSYLFHCTIPFQSSEPRISIAFDVQIM